MSGEVRQAGTAVALGEGEMAIPCKGVPPGAHLTVKLGEIRAKAELGRSRPEIDVCVITARSAPTGTKLRTGIPPATEKLHAVVFDSNGAAIARSVTAAHAVDDANGPRMALRTAGAPLPDGTPLFDHQARLVGFVSGAPGETTPSAIGAGRIAALRPSLRGAPASTTALAKADPQGATSVAPTSSPSPANAPSRAPAASGAGLGTLMDEGFTTLWREDEDLQLSEVLDNAKKGYIGLPLAYWTRWQGRDPERPMVVGCRITLNGDIPVYQYEQAALLHEPDGYFYCALAPTMMDLNLLTKGEYTFEIFVNGRPVAERSIQVERRIMTPTAWMVITLLAGFGLLAFLRRNKVATHPG
jgi:hypothetical protein